MARKEQSQRDKDRRISDIIIASKVIFFEKGYVNTTMQDIAEKSELSRRTIYLYFKSKEDISYYILKEALSSLLRIAQNSIDTNKTGMERLIDFKNAYINFFKEEFQDFYFTIFLDFKINTQLVSSDDIKSCFLILNQIVNIVEESINAGILDGSVNNKILNIRRKSVTILNIIHATMQKLAVRKELLEVTTNYNSEELIDETFDVILSSLRP